MRHVTMDEVEELLPELETVLEQEGMLVLTVEGRPVARIEAVGRLSTADLRARMPFQEVPSEVLIREDRDARD